MTRVESKYYYVMVTDRKEIRCTLRGRLKQEFRLKRAKLYNKDIATVGDKVMVSMNDDGTGTIEEVKERENFVSRKAPRLKGAGFRGERLEQIIAANIDSFFIIVSVIEPDFNNKTLDRFLITAESSHIHPVIIINKIDLDTIGFIDEWADLYRSIGYKVLLTSAENGRGIDGLKELLPGKKSLFWGSSGVGKSSLLNMLYPELELLTANVSGYTGKGMHTTVTAHMLQVDADTYVIDTPGIREIEPFGITKQDLGHYFPEFTEYLHNCKYNTCTHNHEPGCAVMEAVETGKITAERYDSYLRLLDTIEDDIIM